MLHGFPDTAHTWDQLRPIVAGRGYRAVSPYMRGYHPTEIPSNDANAEVLAQDALALIEALGERTAIVIGHDWGALASYGAAALGPDRVRKLIAIGIPHPATLKPTLAQIWGARHFWLYKLPGAASRFAKNDFAALPAICKRWSPTWSPSSDDLRDVRACLSDDKSCHAAFGYYRQLSVRPAPHLRKRIAVPTVVFAGLDDPLIAPAAYHEAKRKFDGDYAVEEVPGGHFMHREHPQKFGERLIAHLPSMA
jgi:pimeloyl-ACP methyl ester carboxylesterase